MSEEQKGNRVGTMKVKSELPPTGTGDDDVDAQTFDSAASDEGVSKFTVERARAWPSPAVGGMDVGVPVPALLQLQQLREQNRNLQLEVSYLGELSLFTAIRDPSTKLVLSRALHALRDHAHDSKLKRALEQVDEERWVEFWGK